MKQKFPVTLEEALNYPIDNQSIINRFRKMYDVPEELVTDLLQCVKYHLWLSQKRLFEEGKGVPILANAYMLDEMWHNFILFTDIYRQYGEALYGKYLHHEPCIGLPEESVTVDDAKQILQYISDHAGEENLKKWYLEWPREYNEYTLKTKYLKIPDIQGERCEG